MNPYIDYYVNQSGSGIRGFSGIRYQRGSGWFSRLFSSAILPALKYLGKQSMKTGLNVAEDVLEGKNFKKAIKARTIETGKETAQKGIQKGKDYLQRGRGKRRKKATTKCSYKKAKLSLF